MLLAITSGIALLLILIIRIRLNAFLSLLIASIWIGLFSGIQPTEIIDTISKGMGDTLAFVATIVGLGTLFGAILEHSGGARHLAEFLVRKTGEKKSRLAMMLSGFFVAIPVFFDVAFIILFPVIQALSKKLKKSILYYALPLLAGIAITHSFIPPTPGPVAVADILKVDLGWMILLGVPIGIPVAIFSGLYVSKYLTDNVPYQEDFEETAPKKPGGIVLLTHVAILIPLMLMVISAVIKTLLQEAVIADSIWVNAIIFIGHPFSALILATLFSIYFLGKRSGLTRDQLFEISNKSLAPAGAIILITGAGGVLKQMLITTGIGTMIAENISGSSYSVLLLAYVVASLVRILQGSATIAMITGAGIVAPVIEMIPDSTMIDKTLLALAIAAGSITVSHVNDSGFWIVNRFLKQEVTATLRSWTILSTVISVSSFLLILVISFFL